MRSSNRRAAQWCAFSIILPVALTLAGCGLFRGKPKPVSGPTEQSGPVRSKEELDCPYFSMVGDTQDLVVFDGKGTTIDNLVYHVTLESIEGKCEYMRRNSALTLSVKVTTTTLIGPVKSKDDKLEVPIFVAATRGDRSIVVKKVQTVTLDRRTGVERTWVGDVSFDLPDDVAGPELDILVGFQLSHAQLERNREFR